MNVIENSEKFFEIFNNFVSRDVVAIMTSTELWRRERERELYGEGQEGE
jgi:hypothetical protein